MPSRLSRTPYRSWLWWAGIFFALSPLGALAQPSGSGTGTPAPRRVAVLELIDHAGIGPKAAAYLTDRVRGAAVVLPRSRFKVLTRENLLALLPPGMDLSNCEGECEVETGRNLGADYVVSGEIVRLGGGLRVALKLHETQSGALLGAEGEPAETIESLDSATEAGARRLLGRLPGAEATWFAAGGGSIRHGVVPPRGEVVVNQLADDLAFLVVTSEPSGARVRIDGNEVGVTPLQIEHPRGVVLITVERALYHPAGERVDLGSSGAQVHLVLSAASGTLRVETATPGVEIYLNGAPMGVTPYVSQARPSGRYALRLEHPCFRLYESEVVLDDGKETFVNPQLEARCGSVSIESEPPGAEILINDTPTDKVTPAVIEAVPRGLAVVRLRMPGYGEAVERVRISGPHREEVRATLIPRLGRLAVTANLENGEPCLGPVRINGESVGNAPWRGELPATTHAVEVECGDLVGRGSIEVVHNAQRTLSLTADETPAPPEGPALGEGSEYADDAARLLYVAGFERGRDIRLLTLAVDAGDPDGWRFGVALDLLNIVIVDAPTAFSAVAIAFGIHLTAEWNLFGPFGLLFSSGVTGGLVPCDDEESPANTELCRQSTGDSASDPSPFLGFGQFVNRFYLRLNLDDVVIDGGMIYAPRFGGDEELLDVGPASGWGFNVGIRF